MNRPIMKPLQKDIHIGGKPLEKNGLQKGKNQERSIKKENLGVRIVLVKEKLKEKLKEKPQEKENQKEAERKRKPKEKDKYYCI
jgi:hypothetical protein